jgi:MFS family permease
MLFQLAVTVGILAAQLINYGTQTVDNGWRISLGLAGVPAILLFIGGLILPESPNSLVERGRLEQGRAVLARLRGTTDVEVGWALWAGTAPASACLRGVAACCLAQQCRSCCCLLKPPAASVHGKAWW